MQKFDKQTRNEAILVLLIEASTPDLTGNTYDTSKALGFTVPVNELAFKAWERVSDFISPGRMRDTADIYAEAAALLADGWNPYDRDDKLVKIGDAS